MTLTRQQLLQDLYQAYYSARRQKSRRSYVKAWERNLMQNMEQLCDDLYYRRYKPLPSKCFIVDYPKKREIFAAQFRDRIVHHLYYNWTHQLFERTFIADSYSCIKCRGTHYGIRRVTDMLRRESRNWQRPCYALHLDIRGYFMHIDRRRLLDMTIASLRKMASHRTGKTSPQTWSDVLDMSFVEWLTEVIVMLDPKENCIIAGEESDWDGLDQSKSLLHRPDGIGLPIGNLTSQLFSNIYLNQLDQFCKRSMAVRRYGRYVDDALLVSADREWLLSLVPRIRQFLHDELGLELHGGKLEVSEVHRGVEFLGVYIKPHRTYVSRHAMKRAMAKISALNLAKPEKVIRSVNSYLGVFRHTASVGLCRRLLMTRATMRYGVFSTDMTEFTDRKYFYKPFKTTRL